MCNDCQCATTAAQQNSVTAEKHHCFNTEHTPAIHGPEQVEFFSPFVLPKRLRTALRKCLANLMVHTLTRGDKGLPEHWYSQRDNLQQENNEQTTNEIMSTTSHTVSDSAWP